MIEYLSLIAIFFSSMVYGIIGFGDALVLIPIIAPIIGVKNAIILVNIWGTFPALLNFIKYRKFLDKGYFIRFLSLAIPATILGTYLIINIRLEWINLTLGVFILSYSSIKLFKYFKYRENVILEKEINTTSPIIFFGGFSYGILTGLISAAGPINVALLERTGHYRESFIENFAAIGTILSLSRIPFYFIANVFPMDLLLIFLLAFPIIFLGTKFGHKITPKIPVKTFQIIIFCFLLVLSIRSIIVSIVNLLSFHF
ncbi:MAG: sulfite exporter TauE/SafE family protein [Candidatus Thorarchaeota archaeon]